MSCFSMRIGYSSSRPVSAWNSLQDLLAEQRMPSLNLDEQISGSNSDPERIYHRDGDEVRISLYLINNFNASFSFKWHLHSLRFSKEIFLVNFFNLTLLGNFFKHFRSSQGMMTMIKSLLVRLKSLSTH